MKKTRIATHHFQGLDWRTDRPALASLLTMLDTMQALVLGLLGELELTESEQLKLLGDMATEAQLSLDFAAAEASGSILSFQTHWSLVEATEILSATRDLSDEARRALRHQNMDEVPEMITMDLADNMRRIKLLLASFEDSMPVMAVSA